EAVSLSRRSENRRTRHLIPKIENGREAAAGTWEKVLFPPANAVASESEEDSEEENILSRLFAMLIATTFVLSAFVGIVPAAQAAATALNVSEILKAFDAQGIPLADGTRAHTDLLAMNPNTPVVAILKLSGDPVAVVKSQMPDMQLSAAQKDAIKAELKARQDALIPTIESLGGRVVGQYQVAYNGIAIQIPRSKLAGLAQLNAVVSVSPVQAFSPAHTTTLPFLGVPPSYGRAPGVPGGGIGIVAVATSVDQTHARSGGRGVGEACGSAWARSAVPADDSMFGPDAPKVKGGTDLVGDNYTGLNTEV